MERSNPPHIVAANSGTEQCGGWQGVVTMGFGWGGKGWGGRVGSLLFPDIKHVYLCFNFLQNDGNS
jgi:hypothetical protein